MADDVPRHTEDMPLEPWSGDAHEGGRVEQGSVTGQAGVSGTQATEFRADEPEEEAEGGA